MTEGGRASSRQVRDRRSCGGSYGLRSYRPRAIRPNYGREMDDPEVAVAIAAGELDGLAAALDKYAASRYEYCYSMAPEVAADAVQDTFIIAWSKLDGLRDPGQLHPWLQAVAVAHPDPGPAPEARQRRHHRCGQGKDPAYGHGPLPPEIASRLAVAQVSDALVGCVMAEQIACGADLGWCGA